MAQKYCAENFQGETEMAEPKAVMGRPRKFDVTVTMSFDLDKKMYDAIEDKEYESNMSKSDFIRKSLMDQLWKLEDSDDE